MIQQFGLEKVTIDALSAIQCQAITQTNADLFSVGLLWRNFSLTQNKFQIF